MATLNHLNLTAYNVPALSALFRDVFGFTNKETRNDKFAVMTNDAGFVLSIMHDKNMSAERGYPGYFHVGFLQHDTAAVDRLHTTFIDNFLRCTPPANARPWRSTHLRLLLRRARRRANRSLHDERLARTA